ncbi:replication protein RepA [Microbacterium rhizomatis]|nr:replication protein RepA [Microbacterium rhizomatis]
MTTEHNSTTREQGPLVVPRNELRLVNYGSLLEQNPGVQDVGFTAKLWAQVSIPYSEPPAGTTVWERRNGSVTLSMRPARIANRQTGVREDKFPFGVAPRYILTWMATEATRTNSRHLEIGGNVAEFLRKVGMTKNGYNATNTTNQMHRLFGADVSVDDQLAGVGGQRGMAAAKFPIADAYQLWFNNDDRSGDNDGLWSSEVVLSKQYFDAIQQASIPVDLNVLRSLKNSPMSIDIYNWATYRMMSLKRDTKIKWEDLAVQFGSNYGRLRAFRSAFERNAHKVSLVYPSLRYEVSADYLTIKPSPTHVRRLDRSATKLHIAS